MLFSGRTYRTFIGFIGVLAFVYLISWLGNVNSLEDEFHTSFLPIAQYKYCDEHEPNDVFPIVAGPILPGEIVVGCFAYPEDIYDLFYFDLAASSSVSITLTNIPETHNYELLLLNEGLSELGRSNNSGNADETIFKKRLRAGRYFIQIHSPPKTEAAGRYSLSVAYEFSSCEEKHLIDEIMPQVSGTLETFPFYSKVIDFRCLADLSTYHMPPLSLNMIYKPPSTGSGTGYWGIATLNNGKGYDASQYGEICVWAYADSLFQSFSINMREIQSPSSTEPHEKSSAVLTISQPGVWEKFCIPLDYFKGGFGTSGEAKEDIEIDSIENVTISFNQLNNKSTIWIGRIEYGGDSCDDHIDVSKIFDAEVLNENNPARFHTFYHQNAGNFQCLGKQVGEDEYVVKLNYQSDEILPGYFGVYSEEAFDVSAYQQICVRVRSTLPGQRFTINFREAVSGIDEKSRIFETIGANAWKTYCENTSHYQPDISLEMIENVTVQFSKVTGSSNIDLEWFDFTND